MKKVIYAVKDLDKFLETYIIPRLQQQGYTAMLESKRVSVAENHEFIFREQAALCLIALVQRYLTGEDWTPSTDPESGDGTIYREGDQLGIMTEHVYVHEIQRRGSEDAEKLIRLAIKAKNDKGREYAKGRMLIVFCDVAGKLHSRTLINPSEGLNFPSICLLYKTKENLEYSLDILKAPAGEKLHRYRIQLHTKPYGIVYREPFSPKN